MERKVKVCITDSAATFYCEEKYCSAVSNLDLCRS